MSLAWRWRLMVVLFLIASITSYSFAGWYGKVQLTLDAQRQSIPGGRYLYSVCHNVGLLGICTTPDQRTFYFLSLTLGRGRWFKTFFQQGGIHLLRGGDPMEIDTPSQEPVRLYGGAWVPCKWLNGLMDAECRDNGRMIEVRTK